MEIIFIAENESLGIPEIVNIPIVQNVEAITCETKDEEFTTINGIDLNIIGGKGLRNFSFSSFFPSKLYSFMRFIDFRPPQYYINFFERYRDAKVPIRIIVVDKLWVSLNMLCRYNFTYTIRDRAGDIPFTLDIKEYIDPNEVSSYV